VDVHSQCSTGSRRYWATGSITSVAFGSNQLVAGTTKATAFRLSVGVVTAKGGRPPLYVLNTDAKQP
jgi:hypothetical protein